MWTDYYNRISNKWFGGIYFGMYTLLVHNMYIRIRYTYGWWCRLYMYFLQTRFSRQKSNITLAFGGLGSDLYIYISQTFRVFFLFLYSHYFSYVFSCVRLSCFLLCVCVSSRIICSGAALYSMWIVNVYKFRVSAKNTCAIFCVFSHFSVVAELVSVRVWYIDTNSI